MTKKELTTLAKSYITDYLKYHYPQLKINKTNLFDCPFKHEHENDNGRPSCKIYPQYGYKVTCYQCGELGNIYSIFRRIEPDMANLKDSEIAEYLTHLLNIKENASTDKLLAKYYESDFHLIPLQPNSKNPIQGESWKKNICHDINKWKEWVEAGLGLGLVCGAKSKIMTIDIDVKDIPEEIKNIANDTLTQDTKKGWHLIYEYDSDFDQVNHINLRRKGYEIDIRMNNSYIVVAPTVVDDYTRTWNNKKISIISPDFKTFLLDLINKDKPQENSDKQEDIKKVIEEEDFEIGDLIKEGERDDSLTKIGGIFRKKMNASQVLSVLSFINRNFCKPPISNLQLRKIIDSLNKYDTYDKKELAKEIHEHLQLESVKLANTHDLTKSLGYTKKEIEDSLDYLVKEQKVTRIGKHFRALNKVDWETDFMGLSKPLGFEVPYFDNYAKFENSSMIIVGGRTGQGKTHLSMNFIRELVERKITPYYVCTEAGSKFSLIGASLGLKEGDYKFKVVPDATSIELEDNAVTVIDWIKPPSSDYSKMDTVMENLNHQLIRHGGLLIAMVQIRKDGSFFAPDLIDFYASLVATYNWTTKTNSKTQEVSYDAENTYLKTSKIRDSKVGLQYLKIPTHYNKETKKITLRNES